MNIAPIKNVFTAQYVTLPEKSLKYRKMLFEDEIDSFVSSVIQKERASVGKIYHYEHDIPPHKLNKINEDMSDSVDVFILNENIHIIKQDTRTNCFFDIVKKWTGNE